MIVVRIDLIRPDRLAGRGPARKERGRPFVIAGPLVGVPGARIGCAVIDQVEFGIVGDPAPAGSSADLPLLALPGFRPDRSAVHCIERLEIRPDQDVFVGSGAVSAPDDLAGLRIKPGQPAAHAELAAAVADDHLPLATIGAMVIDSPMLISPRCVFQTSLPVLASTATVCTSSVL